MVVACIVVVRSLWQFEKSTVGGITASSRFSTARPYEYPENDPLENDFLHNFVVYY
jgi:hypothetical protein